MKEIPLTRGMKALVDDEDFEELNRFNWQATPGNNGKLWYARTTLRLPDGNTFVCQMQHAVLKVRPSRSIVPDHIDGDGLNNQKYNLRLLTRRQNTQDKHRTYTSKYPGVSWHKLTGKWIAHIMISRKIKHLGSFDSEEEAFERYKWAVSLCGQEVLAKKGE
jgi:hypothetical protein